MRFFIKFFSLKTYTIKIVGSDKPFQDLVILMENNDLISGQLVEEDRLKKMRELYFKNFYSLS